MNTKRIILLLVFALLTAGPSARSGEGRSLSLPPNLGPWLAAETDSTVRISWNQVSENGGLSCRRHAKEPDSFQVWFCETGGADYRLVGSTDSTTLVHEPQGMTGRYRVSAWFGEEERIYQIVATTEPFYHSAELVELNAAGNAGFGWRDGSAGQPCSMSDSTSAATADFYVTDFAVGYAGPEYFIASPSLGPADPGGGIPEAGWRTSGFAAAGPDGNPPSFARDPGSYTDRSGFDSTPTVISCRTQNGQFAQVRVVYLDLERGVVNMSLALQPVKGLRLVRCR